MKTRIHKAAFVLTVFSLLTTNIFGRLEDANQTEQAADTQNTEQAEKIPANISLRYFKKADGSESVKVSVWYKEGKKNVPVERAVVNLYLDEISREGMMTNVITDENGEGVFLLTDRFYKRAEGKYEYTFIARMMSEELYEPTEEEIIVKRCEIVLTVSDEDSSIAVVLNQIAGKDSIVPVPDAEIKIGIKRSFSVLPIGDPLTTDENGSASVVCPGDIPGDSLGNLVIVAKIEDHDEFGNCEAEKSVKWGVPVKQAAHESRTLWAPGNNAPLPLVTASLAIVFGIWGVLIYLMFQLYRIKKISKRKN